MAVIKLIQHEDEETITETFLDESEIQYVIVYKELIKKKWTVTKIGVTSKGADGLTQDFEGDDLEPNYRALEPWMKNQGKGETI